MMDPTMMMIMLVYCFMIVRAQRLLHRHDMMVLISLLDQMNYCVFYYYELGVRSRVGGRNRFVSLCSVLFCDLGSFCSVLCFVI